MITKEKKHQVEITEDGVIQVRETTYIIEDGKEIAKTYHRKCIEPESDVTNEIQIVKDIAPKVWTEEVKDKWKAKKNNG